MTEELQPVEALARTLDPDAFAGDPSPDRDVWYWDARRHLAREHAGRALAAGWTQIPRRAGRTYWDNQPEERVRFALLGALTELMETERVLAKVLGYPRGDGGPNDPTGGDFITGEHTAVSLAMEAARALRETGERIATYSSERAVTPSEVVAPGDPLEAREPVGRLAHQVARQIAETHGGWPELAARWEYLTDFWRDLFMAVGATCFRQGGKAGNEAAELELASLRDHCARCWHAVTNKETGAVESAVARTYAQMSAVIERRMEELRKS